MVMVACCNGTSNAMAAAVVPYEQQDINCAVACKWTAQLCYALQQKSSTTMLCLCGFSQICTTVLHCSLLLLLCPSHCSDCLALPHLAHMLFSFVMLVLFCFAAIGMVSQLLRQQPCKATGVCIINALFEATRAGRLAIAICAAMFLEKWLISP